MVSPVSPSLPVSVCPCVSRVGESTGERKNGDATPRKDTRGHTHTEKEKERKKETGRVRETDREREKQGG